MKKTFSNPFTGKQETNDVSELFDEIQRVQSPSPKKEPLSQIDQPSKTPKEVVQPSNQATMQPRNHVTMLPSNHATMQPPGSDEEIVSAIVTNVSQFGKKPATYRFTPEEKSAIVEVVFDFHQRGDYKANDNLLVRMGVMWLIQDYRMNRENSMLVRVLKELK